MFARIIRSLDLMLVDYRPGAKSRHWAAFFTSEMAASLRDESELKRFRARSSPLHTDVEEPGHWFRTADAFERLRRAFGLDWFDRYSECQVGEPQAHRIAGRRVNLHDILLCHHHRVICESLGKDARVIVEIGGGFGALAHKLKIRFPGASIVLLDLPEALTLQAYYLWRLHPKARFYLFDDHERGLPLDPAEYDFILLPGWLVSHLEADGVDLFINIRSMMEMNRETIADYFSHIHRCLKTDGLFYNVNRYRKDTVGEPIRLREYPYDDRWSVVSSRSSFLQPHLHELIARRATAATSEMRMHLASLSEDRRVIKDTRHRSVFRRLALLPLAFSYPRVN